MHAAVSPAKFNVNEESKQERASLMSHSSILITVTGVLHSTAWAHSK